MVGIKPSRGRVSNAPNSNPRGGLITHGPIARTVRDAALMLDVMAGSEPGDPFTRPDQTPSFLASTERDPQPPPHRNARHERQVDRSTGRRRRAPDGRSSRIARAPCGTAGVDLTGLGRLFRVMVEAESAANEVEDPRAFSDSLFELVLRERREADRRRVHPCDRRDVSAEPRHHPRGR